MGRRQIFNDVVQLAIDNGWNCFGFVGKPGFKWSIGNRTQESFVLICYSDDIKLFDYRPTEVFFNHAFNQAIWGDDWKKKLQAMSIHPDVFLYLVENLNRRK